MKRLFVLLVMFGLAALFAGCIGAPQGGAHEMQKPGAGDAGAGQQETPSEPDAQQDVLDETGSGTESDGWGESPGDGGGAAGDGGTSVQGGSGGLPKVLLTGRSVANGWTEYMGLPWECDDEECATGSPRGEYNGYYFMYYGLDYPPDIAMSAARGADLYGSDADVVFFKFCFVDFASDDTLQNAHDNERLVEDVYQYIVVDRHKKLIVGNALPQVSRDSDQHLVANHREFDAWLDEFAATHENVQVLDLNGMLTNSDGSLKSQYAMSSEDSHLNLEGYEKITPQFIALLENSGN